MLLIAYKADPDPRLRPPNNLARGMDVVGADYECEVVGYADGRNYVERCTGLGKVSDRAINRTAAKRNLSRF